MNIAKPLKTGNLIDNTECITSNVEKCQSTRYFSDHTQTHEILTGNNACVNRKLSINSKLVNVTNSQSFLRKTVSFVDNKSRKILAKNSITRFKCYKCNRCFPTYSEVVFHLKLIHNACASSDCSKIADFKMHSSVCVNRGFGCAVCNKKFSEKYLLLAHFNEHIDAAFYACQICRKGFQQLKDLQKHLHHLHGRSALSPTTPSPPPTTVYQKCANCLKYYKLFAEFEEHSSLCNSPTYACCICRVIFPTSSTLDEHRLAEHRVKHAVKGYAAFIQGKKYFCSICYLGFFKGNILKKHLVTHKIEINFICDVCSENFMCDDDLQSHYLQHIEEHYVLHDLISQHSCKPCMKTFKTQRELKEHLVTNNCESSKINASTGCMQVKESNNNNASEGDLEALVDVPSDINISEMPIYALKSGEELLNCDDSKCVIVMDLVSLFVLQRGLCASENRMPDVSCSEVYTENDVIDSSLLQNHMIQIFSTDNGNNLPNSENTTNSLNSVDASLLEQNSNSNIDSATIGTVVLNLDESSDTNSMMLGVLENNEFIPVSECKGSDNKTSEFLVCDANAASFINIADESSTGDAIIKTEVSSASDVITETKVCTKDVITKTEVLSTDDTITPMEVPTTNNQANNETMNQEMSIEYYDEFSISHHVHVCNICKQVFSTKTSLCLHVKGSHTGFDCYRCGASFNSDEELKNHERILHHSSFQCDLCEVSYPKEHLLKKHKRSAHGGKGFTCHICDKSYALKNEYQVHMMKHSGKAPPTKCEICGKVYASVSNYVRHKAMHEGKTPAKNYVCTICDKAFVASIPLKLHLRTHIRKSLSTYECPKCKMYFPHKILDKHIKSHDMAC